MKIILAGGTGFIGKALLRRLLDQKHEVVLLSRGTRAPVGFNDPNLKIRRWNAKDDGDWSTEVSAADAIINLSGESIAQRWTQTVKERIRSSRIEATRAIVNAITNASKKPSVLINSSAVGYYGNVPEGDVSESHPKGTGFLADTCAEWEAEAQKAEALGVRVVLIRTGIVLEKGGGALPKFIFPFKMYAGGPLGSGRQWFPWIHREDVVDAIIFSLIHPTVEGAVNAAAPDPKTMRDFCADLGRALHRPSWAPVPSFALKILFGEMAEMLLQGQKCVPDKLQKAGYHFRYARLDDALRAIFILE
jgi:hypothetical protein